MDTQLTQARPADMLPPEPRRRKMLFFLNPKAGRAEIRSSLLDVINLFTANGYDVTVHPTQRAKEIPDLIRAMGEQYDCIVTCGGDGTLNETVSGLVQLKNPPLLGYLPTGTVNDFATSLGLPRDPMQAAQVVISGDEFLCDVGMFNGRAFAYVAAFGAFTAVSYETPRAEKHALGRAAYILEGIRSLPEIRPYWVQLEHDGIVEEDEVIFGMVTNSTSIGGFRALPGGTQIKLDDGLSEVVLVRKIRTVMDMNAVTSSLLRQEFSPDHFLTFKTDALKMTFREEVPWTLDGEFGGNVMEADIRNLHRAVRVMVPAE
jgi:diacylglycerol kinase (ATP)